MLITSVFHSCTACFPFSHTALYTLSNEEILNPSLQSWRWWSWFCCPQTPLIILISHYYCGRKISWYHHSGRKPDFSSETSSIWLLVSSALFPLVVSAKSLLIGHNNFLSWTSLLNRKGGERPCVFPSWGGLQNISKHWEIHSSPDDQWGHCSQKQSIPSMCHHKLGPSKKGENYILN